MKTLSTPVTTQAAAEQSGWCEVFDFYLKASIVTPWGTTQILRLVDLPGGFAFFTPKISPEASGTQGNAASYNYWNIKREVVKSDSKFTNDKLRIMASNVSVEWAAMLMLVDWYDTPVMIRKVPFTVAGLTADDCAIIWSGQIDSVKITEQQLQFECSNELANLQATAPRENMHTNCRFSWGDDLCTKIKYLAANYKSGTVGNSSTTTVVISSDLTEDTSAYNSYGTDRIDALADANIAGSSEGYTLVNQAVSLSDPNGAGFYYISLGGNKFSQGDPVQFTATTMPTPLSAGVTYYIWRKYGDYFLISAAPGDGAPISISTAGSAVKISTTQSYAASAVKESNDGYWKLGNPADWGTETQGFWQIPDLQAGLANCNLKPYIHFDLGTARALKLWRISTIAAVRLEELAKMLCLFSGTDLLFGTNWRLETYMYCPPVGGVLYEFQVPNARSARYWRIAVRSRWSQALFYALINKVEAYEDSRHYWAFGRITFDAATATVALRGVSRTVRESYAGRLVCAQLPVAPANGDTFKIERGCPRTFNACCARGNWENYGGFLDLPYQTVIR